MEFTLSVIPKNLDYIMVFYQRDLCDIPVRRLVHVYQQVLSLIQVHNNSHIVRSKYIVHVGIYNTQFKNSNINVLWWPLVYVYDNPDIRELTINTHLSVDSKHILTCCHQTQWWDDFDARFQCNMLFLLARV